MARREARFARRAQQRNAPQYSFAATTCRHHDAARFSGVSERPPAPSVRRCLRNMRDVRVCSAAHWGRHTLLQRGLMRDAARLFEPVGHRPTRPCTGSFARARQRPNASMHPVRRAAFETNPGAIPLGELPAHPSSARVPREPSSISSVQRAQFVRSIAAGPANSVRQTPAFARSSAASGQRSVMRRWPGMPRALTIRNGGGPRRLRTRRHHAIELERGVAQPP